MSVVVPLTAVDGRKVPMVAFEPGTSKKISGESSVRIHMKGCTQWCSSHKFFNVHVCFFQYGATQLVILQRNYILAGSKHLKDINCFGTPPVLHHFLQRQLRTIGIQKVFSLYQQKCQVGAGGQNFQQVRHINKQVKRCPPTNICTSCPLQVVQTTLQDQRCQILHHFMIRF